MWKRIDKIAAGEQQDFFGQAARGEHAPMKPLEENFTPNQQSLLDTFNKHKGHFDEHIETSIPNFRKNSLGKMNAIVQAYPQNARMLDIASSEGSLGKTITEASGGRIKTTNLDPQEQMINTFNTKSQVPGAESVSAAFGASFEDEKGNIVPKFAPKHSYDVVHESMAFQFFGPEREEHIAEAKRLLAPNGIFLSEEKVRTDNEAENEAQKDAWKAQYHTPEALQKKQEQVGFQGEDTGGAGMMDKMVHQDVLESLLKKYFKFVVQYWSSGNFKGYAASDSKERLAAYVNNYEFEPHEFETEQTPRSLHSVKESSQQKQSHWLDGFYAAVIDPKGEMHVSPEWGATHVLTVPEYDMIHNSYRGLYNPETEELIHMTSPSEDRKARDEYLNHPGEFEDLEEHEKKWKDAASKKNIPVSNFKALYFPEDEYYDEETNLTDYPAWHRENKMDAFRYISPSEQSKTSKWKKRSHWLKDYHAALVDPAGRMIIANNWDEIHQQALAGKGWMEGALGESYRGLYNPHTQEMIHLTSPNERNGLPFGSRDFLTNPEKFEDISNHEKIWRDSASEANVPISSFKAAYRPEQFDEETGWRIDPHWFDENDPDIFQYISPSDQTKTSKWRKRSHWIEGYHAAIIDADGKMHVANNWGDFHGQLNPRKNLDLTSRRVYHRGLYNKDTGQLLHMTSPEEWAKLQDSWNYDDDKNEWPLGFEWFNSPEHFISPYKNEKDWIKAAEKSKIPISEVKMFSGEPKTNPFYSDNIKNFNLHSPDEVAQIRTSKWKKVSYYEPGYKAIISVRNPKTNEWQTHYDKTLQDDLDYEKEHMEVLYDAINKDPELKSAFDEINTNPYTDHLVRGIYNPKTQELVHFSHSDFQPNWKDYVSLSENEKRAIHNHWMEQAQKSGIPVSSFRVRTDHGDRSSEDRMDWYYPKPENIKYSPEPKESKLATYGQRALAIGDDAAETTFNAVPEVHDPEEDEKIQDVDGKKKKWKMVRPKDHKQEDDSYVDPISGWGFYSNFDIDSLIAQYETKLGKWHKIGAAPLDPDEEYEIPVDHEVVEELKDHFAPIGLIPITHTWDTQNFSLTEQPSNVLDPPFEHQIDLYDPEHKEKVYGIRYQLNHPDKYFDEDEDPQNRYATYVNSIHYYEKVNSDNQYLKDFPNPFYLSKIDSKGRSSLRWPEFHQARYDEIQERHPYAAKRMLGWMAKNLPRPFGADIVNPKLKEKAIRHQYIESKWKIANIPFVPVSPRTKRPDVGRTFSDRPIDPGEAPWTELTEGKGRIIPDYLYGGIIKKYQEGMSTAQLGKEYNVNRSTIDKLLKNNGIVLRGTSKGKVTNLTPEQVQEIIKDYTENNFSIRKIQNKYQVGYEKLIKILNENNIPVRAFGEIVERKRKISLEDHQDIINKYLSGMSTTQLGKEYNVWPSAIGKILKKNNIKLRRIRSKNILGKWEKVSVPPADLVKEFSQKYEQGQPPSELHHKYPVRGHRWQFLPENFERLYNLEDWPLRTKYFVNALSKEDLGKPRGVKSMDEWSSLMGEHHPPGQGKAGVKSGAIFINPLLSPEAANEALWHELQHAYQHQEKRWQEHGDAYVNPLELQGRGLSEDEILEKIKQYYQHPMELDANEFADFMRKHPLIQETEPHYNPNWVPEEHRQNAQELIDQYYAEHGSKHRLRLPSLKNSKWRFANEWRTGQCDAFAIAAHDLTGWPIYKIAETPNDGAWHFFVEDPETGRALDGDGFRSVEDILMEHDPDYNPEYEELGIYPEVYPSSREEACSYQSNSEERSKNAENVVKHYLNKQSKWKIAKEDAWETVLDGELGHDIITTGTWEEVKKQTIKWLKQLENGYINKKNPHDNDKIDADAKEQDGHALEDLKLYEEKKRWSFHFDHGKHPYDLIIQPVGYKESKWIRKEAPARSKAQFRYMQGICNGSIEPPEGMTRSQACEYVKGQDDYKKLPEKKSHWVEGFHAAVIDPNGKMHVADDWYDVHGQVLFENEWPFNTVFMSHRGLYNPETKELFHMTSPAERQTGAIGEYAKDPDQFHDLSEHEEMWRDAAKYSGIPVGDFKVLHWTPKKDMWGHELKPNWYEQNPRETFDYISPKESKTQRTSNYLDGYHSAVIYDKNGKPTMAYGNKENVTHGDIAWTRDYRGLYNPETGHLIHFTSPSEYKKVKKEWARRVREGITVGPEYILGKDNFDATPEEHQATWQDAAKRSKIPINRFSLMYHPENAEDKDISMFYDRTDPELANLIDVKEKPEQLSLFDNLTPAQKRDMQDEIELKLVNSGFSQKAATVMAMDQISKMGYYLPGYRAVVGMRDPESGQWHMDVGFNEKLTHGGVTADYINNLGTPAMRAAVKDKDSRTDYYNQHTARGIYHPQTKDFVHFSHPDAWDEKEYNFKQLSPKERKNIEKFWRDLAEQNGIDIDNVRILNNDSGHFEDLNVSDLEMTEEVQEQLAEINLAPKTLEQRNKRINKLIEEGMSQSDALNKVLIEEWHLKYKKEFERGGSTKTSHWIDEYHSAIINQNGDMEVAPPGEEHWNKTHWDIGGRPIYRGLYNHNTKDLIHMTSPEEYDSRTIEYLEDQKDAIDPHKHEDVWRSAAEKASIPVNNFKLLYGHGVDDAYHYWGNHNHEEDFNLVSLDSPEDKLKAKNESEKNQINNFWLEVLEVIYENEFPDQAESKTVAQLLEKYQETGESPKITNSDKKYIWQEYNRIIKLYPEDVEVPEGLDRKIILNDIKKNSKKKEKTMYATKWRRVAKPNLVPPEGARAAARRGIKYHSEGKAGDGFEAATLNRAHKIAEGKELTPEHVKRMHSFFERHAGGRSQKAKKGEVTPWDVAWLAWGGNAGRSWAAAKVKELEKSEKTSNKNCKCWDGYKRVPGTKPCAPGSCEKCDSHRKKK